MDGVNILVVSTIILVAFTIYLYKKETNFKLSVLVFSVYSLSSFISIIFFSLPFSEAYITEEISYWPFFYWLVVLCIFCIPIFRFDKSNIKCIQYDYSFLKKIVYFGFVISIIPFIEQLALFPSLLSQSGGDIADGMVELHDEAQEEGAGFIGLSLISRICLKMNMAIYDLSYLILLVFFLHKQKSAFAIFSIFFIIITRNLTGLLLGHRGSMVEVLLKLLLISLIALPLLKEDSKQKLRRIVIFSGAIFVGILSFITIARATSYSSRNEEFTLLFFVARYGGEGLVNFNQYLPIMQRTVDGELTFGWLRQVLGLTPSGGSYDMWASIEQAQGIPQNIFYTFIGNFVQDFGFVGAFIWLSFVSFFFVRLTTIKGSIIKLSTLYIFVFYAMIAIYGLTSYRYNGFNGKYIFLHFFIYILLRLKKM